MKNALVESSEAIDLNAVTTALSIVETIEGGMTSKKTTGFVLHVKMSIFRGERNATVVAKAKTGTSKPTNPPSETTIDQTIVETDLNRNVMDATIGNAPHVATLTSHSERNATAVESQSLAAVMVDLVEAFQTVVNEAVEIQNDEVEAVTEAVDSVEVVVEIQTDVVEAATEAVDSVEVVVEIQTDVVEAADGGRGRDSDRRGGRRDGGRDFGGNRDSRDTRRDSGRGRPNRDRNDERPNERYRKARGKRPGHAHNRGPQPIRPRRYQGKDRDD